MYFVASTAPADALVAPSIEWEGFMTFAPYNFGDTRPRYEAMIANWGGSIITVTIDGVEIEFGVVTGDWVHEFITGVQAGGYGDAFDPPTCRQVVGYGIPNPPA